jgi:hypothetical protein
VLEETFEFAFEDALGSTSAMSSSALLNLVIVCAMLSFAVPSHCGWRDERAVTDLMS